MKKYIAFDAGCGIWEVVVFDSSIEWHDKEMQFDSKKGAIQYASEQMIPVSGHYDSPEYESIFDY